MSSYATTKSMMNDNPKEIHVCQLKTNFYFISKPPILPKQPNNLNLPPPSPQPPTIHPPTLNKFTHTISIPTTRRNFPQITFHRIPSAIINFFTRVVGVILNF